MEPLLDNFTVTKLVSIIAVLVGILNFGNPSDAHNDTEQKILMVHYMPWFASKSISGNWGWHWTMNRYNPDEVDAMTMAREPALSRQWNLGIATSK